MNGDEMLGEPSEFERQLLEAARAERPSAELSARMADALGLPTPVNLSPPLQAAKGAVSAWIGLSALAILGGSVLLWALWPRHSAEPVAPTEPKVQLVAQQAPPPQPLSAPALGDARSTEAAPLAPSSRPASKPSVPIASARGDLREEIRLIDAARAAVANHAADQALSLLQRYSATYPGGVFGQEASVLRMEALSQSGQQARAKTLAREFLARHPNSPLAERAERVLK